MKRKKKMHMLATRTGILGEYEDALCEIESYLLTDDPDQVTCKHCLREMRAEA